MQPPRRAFQPVTDPRPAAGRTVPSFGLDWSVIWEDDLVAADHAAIAALLARCFPRSRTPFGGTRSWSSGRPELRLIGRHDGRALAHLGVLRRFLRVDGQDRFLLIGDVGLVAVDPDAQGRGIGAELLGRAAAQLRALQVPFGFLTCGDHVAGFYAGGGWTRTPGPTRMVRADATVQVYGGISMVLPVCSGLDEWPSGRRVDRNGLEL